MKIARNLFTVLTGVCLVFTVRAQDFSNRGKEFWLAYCYHVGMINPGGPPTMTLYLTSDVSTTYTVEIFGTAVIQAGTINAGQVVTVIVPPAYFINDEGTFARRSIHVTAAKSIVVYSYITRSQASGASLNLPVQVLGKEYYAMSFTQISNEPNSNSYVTIVAVEDNTTVEITPSANTKNGWSANNTYSVNLNKGDIYQVLGAMHNPDDGKGADLTGTHVKSVSSGTQGCKRIAVFSGSGKLRIPEACNSTSSDNLYQQLYPVGSWGLHYLTAPSYSNPYNYYRIAKSNPAANVYVNGNLIPASSFVNGIWYELFNNIPNYIQSDLPISVAQYFPTQGCNGNTALGDPDMIVLNPLEQTIDRVTLVSSNLVAPGTQTHHLQVIIPNGGTSLSSFRLDGHPVSGWAVHPANPSFSYIYLADVGQGYHTLASDSGFNALAYGFAAAESYGYSAGSNVKDLYQFISIRNQYATVNFPAGCRNSPFNFAMTFPYQPTEISWKFFGLFSDTTIFSPAYDSTWIVNGRQLYRYSLPGTYAVPAAGSYPVEVIAQNPSADGCSGEQQIDYDLQVFERPTVDFSFSTKGCVTDAVQFTGTINANGRTVVSQAWSFGDASTAGGSTATHTYGAAGSYNAGYNVITDVGCISDTATKTIAVSDAPVADFQIPTPICSNGSSVFNDQSTAPPGPAINKWTWNFGDVSAAVVSSTSAPQTHVYGVAGNATVTLVVESGSGCKSLPISKPVSIHPSAIPAFSFTNACLPSGLSNFTDQSTIAGGSIVNWSWDFGDGGIASIASPSHNYTTTGPFNVNLAVTSDAGCISTLTRVMDKIYAQPQAAFTAPVKVCTGSTGILQDASTAPGSSVTGWQWQFADGSTSSQTNPSISFSGNGPFDVSLIVTSAAGCISAPALQAVIVDPLPVAAFAIGSAGCAGQPVLFADQSTAAAGTIVKWTWDYGDGSAAINAVTAASSHTYQSTGSYSPKLTVTTDEGCVSIVHAAALTVHPVPEAGFVIPGNCVDDPSSAFTDTSKIADGSAASFMYNWDFGDAHASPGNPNTSVAQHPQHKYTAADLYQVTEMVTSNAGCSNSVTRAVMINGSVPVPRFAFPAIAVCGGDTIEITDRSIVSPGNVIRVEVYWDYQNDPTDKSVADWPTAQTIFSHKYPSFISPTTLTRTIRYVAYSGQTCVQYLDSVIVLHALPDLAFDPVQGVCNNAPSFQLPAPRVVNSEEGGGSFTGKAVSSSGMFTPTRATAGSNDIAYHFTSTDGCMADTHETIDIFAVPSVNAGPDKQVLQGKTVQLTPVIQSTDPVSITWSPDAWLDDPAVRTPEASPPDDVMYTVTVSSAKGCIASDNVFVKVLKAPQIPNIFSPNGDGIHDTWQIPNLAGYPGCTIDVYNRYGQLILHENGYEKPWDGRVNGQPVPVGTYYYIIDPRNGRPKLSGYVDIVR